MDIVKLMEQTLPEEEVRRLHPLKLAFIGDAVFECYIREYVLDQPLNMHELAIYASKFVRATAQSAVVRELKEELSETEWQMVLKGRNKNPKTVPKNAKVSEYRYATGFETMVGYLAMSGQRERLTELVGRSIEIIEKELLS